MATRRERVVLELEDQFTTGMARAAASAALLNRELDSLSRDSIRTRRSISDIDSTTTRFSRNAGGSAREVDKLSGRMRILADVAAILGPSLVPIGAVGIPAVTGLAAQLGFTGVAAGTAVLAFQGIGTALKAANKAAIEPTTANLKAAQVALDAISPSAQKFVAELRTMMPELHRLQQAAADGLLPGVTAGLAAMETALPKVEAVLSAVSTELGDIATHTGVALASPKWTEFLDFLGREAPSALAEMATAAGHTAHAVAALWMATDPLNDDFSKWLVNATADIDRWATSLSHTQGFADFIAYVETTGPKVAATLGAIADAGIQILQAVAPLGGPVLDGIKALADVVSAIANSDLGTPLFSAVAALALFNRTLAVTGALQKATFGGPALASIRGMSAGLRGLSADLALVNRQSAVITMPGKGFIGPLTEAQAARGRLNTSLAGIGKASALIGGLTVAASGAADKIHATNAASLALMGTFIAPGWGTAVGAAVGGAIDLTHANDGLEDAIKRVTAAARASDFSTMDEQIQTIQSRIDDIQHSDLKVGFRGNISGVGDFVGDTASKIGDALSHPFDIHPGDERVARGKKAIADAEAIAATRRATAATQDYQAVFLKTGDVIASTTTQIDGLVAAMENQRTEALSAFDAETSYRQALKDAGEQAKKSNAGIKGNSDEALKNRELIGQLAAAWNNQSDAVKNNKARFDEAKKSFIETATAMGVPIEQAKRLARRLLDIPKQVVIDAHFSDGAALGAIRRIKRELAGVPKRLRTDYYVNQVNAFNKLSGGGRDGDPTTPFAGGGWTGPGAKYQPAGVVHAEEFVVKRGPAAQFRPWLESLNRLPGYAGGGMVQPFPQASAVGPAIDYDRLAAAMSAVRPLYGDVTVQPHNYGEFTRQMAQDHKLSSLDGVRR